MDSLYASANRHYLYCTRCKKTYPSLSVHLKRTCMKNATAEEIAAVLDSAKKRVAELLQAGILWEYGLIVSILQNPSPINRLIKELEDRGNAVLYVPPVPVEPAPAPLTETPDGAGGSAAGKTTEEGSEELCQRERPSKCTTSVRAAMEKRGLYQKHSTNHPLLRAFGAYLKTDLINGNYKQEVENVARFLFYIDPSRPSLDFVRKHEDTRKYFKELSDVGLSKQTIQNYMKSLKRFIKFHTRSTDLCSEDSQLHQMCNNFIDFVASLQAALSKQVSEEATKKRYESFTRESPKPPQCLAVLRAARGDFLAIMGKLLEPGYKTISCQQKQMVLYYLQALLVLKHQQRPGLVENMTVEDWRNRKRIPGYPGYCVVSVVKHKTSETQVPIMKINEEHITCCFALTQEEEMWFDLFYKYIRPTMLTRKRKLDEDLRNSNETFFISSSGKKIYNCSNDIHHLHEKYQLPNITSQMARRAFKTATKALDDTQKSLVAEYLAHTTTTTQKYDRMREPENVISVAQILSHISGESQSSSNEPEAFTSCHVFSEQTAYDLLLKAFPVTLDDKCPSKTDRIKIVGSACDRYCYDHWRSEQRLLRNQHVLEHCRRKPTKKHIRILIEKQGWTVNIPDAQFILDQWKRKNSTDTDMDCQILKKLVRTQNWKGLCIYDIPSKGRGVVATRVFASGEVVCDYHGKTVSLKDGLKIHAFAAQGQTENVVFYKNSSGVAMYIDAHNENCDCHPGKDTPGRFINHSHGQANLRSRLYALDDSDVILFIALRDINVDEELLFDYEENRKSFTGCHVQLRPILVCATPTLLPRVNF
ncbi:uncharacterized protein [Paramormyrops kingsleyae]|uniref:uncharacterized protein n=1 Tax=Paramormyrops kingsleyae TaxID=1676925 RepID=UPI003B97A588